MTATLTIRCSRCGKEQMPREKCVRCEKKLPDVVFVVMEKVVERERVIEKSAPAPIPSLETGEISSLDQAEKSLIRRAIAHTNGDRLIAARLLGIGKTTLYRKLREMESEAAAQ